MTRHERQLEDLLAECLRHDERGYGSWTSGMRDRVRRALRRRQTRRPLVVLADIAKAVGERRRHPR